MIILLLFMNLMCWSIETGDTTVTKNVMHSTTILKRKLSDNAMELAVMERLKSRKVQYFYTCDAINSQPMVVLRDVDAKQHYARLKKLNAKK